MISTRSNPRSRTARRLSWLVVAGLVSAALLAPGASPVFAADIAPNANSIELVAGNPTCGEGQDLAFKIDGTPGNGTTSNGVVDITNATDFSFDWAINPAYLGEYVASAVIVKGGPNAYVYFYADSTDTFDTNLQSPDNEGGQQAAISHVEFCFDKKDIEPTPTPTVEPTPTPTVEPTPTPTVEPTPTPTVEPTPTPTGEVEPTATPSVDPTATPSGEVLAATGTPGVTLPPTDSVIASTAAPAAENWRIVVLMMAGLLALALLLTPASLATSKRKSEDR
jgi:hypothetical protein